MSTHCLSLNIFNKGGRDRGLITLNYLIIFSLFFMVLFYLFQTNSLVDYSYKIREKEKAISELEERNHGLEIEIARLRSPLNLEEAIRPLGLVEVKDAVYLNQQEEVAVKK